MAARIRPTKDKERHLALSFAIVAICSLCLGIGATYGAMTNFSGDTASSSPSLRLSTSSKLISPLLLCGDHHTALGEKVISTQLDDYIRTRTAEGAATDISYYLRELNTGQWSASNENDRYAPASLMKVPILIAVLKQSEDQPGFLQQEMTFTSKVDEDKLEFYQPKEQLVLGKSYTIDELLRYMSEDSDNNATVMLLSVVSDQKLAEVYTDLGLPIPQNATAAVDFMTPQIYTKLFRILYNATYLNQADSAKALQLLDNREFSGGLIGGVPSGIDVAHKYGERTVTNNGAPDHRELHDCGIVYAPNKPYALCIMTSGKDFSALQGIIKDMSGIVYKGMTGK